MGLASLPLSNNDLFLPNTWPVAGRGGRQVFTALLECSLALEVLLVEDELDVGLRVGQALFLQRLAQLRRATQEHPDLGPE